MKVDEKCVPKGEENVMGERLRINFNRWSWQSRTGTYYILLSKIQEELINCLSFLIF